MTLPHEGEGLMAKGVEQKFSILCVKYLEKHYWWCNSSGRRHVACGPTFQLADDRRMIDCPARQAVKHELKFNKNNINMLEKCTESNFYHKKRRACNWSRLAVASANSRSYFFTFSFFDAAFKTA